MYGRQSRLGHLLALVALCLQLVAPALVVPRAPSAAQEEFTEFLRLHALCLGGDPALQRPGAPGQDRPDQTGHHVGACCFLHGNTSAFPVPPGTVQPVAFRFSEILFPARASAEVSVRPVAAPQARAPPSEA